MRLAYLLAILLFAGPLHLLQAQDNDLPVSNIRVDLSYGLPIYFGEFFPFGSEPAYVNRNGASPLELVNYSQYNQSNISASVIADLNDRIGLRLKMGQTIFFFAEETQANINFKNSLFDASLLFQVDLLTSRTGIYLYGGPGFTIHKDARIFVRQLEMETAFNTERETGFTLTGGLGFDVEIGKKRRFELFVEAEYLNTGSDRVDGYNGYSFNDGLPQINEEEGPYFQRDYFLNARGGIRLKLFKPAPRQPERPFDAPLSSLTPDPTKADLTEDEKESLFDELGVQQNLSGGYSIEVNFVVQIPELRRQKEVAKSVAEELRKQGIDVEVLLLNEPLGFSIHFGYFSSREEAKKVVRKIRQYYSDIIIHRN